MNNDSNSNTAIVAIIIVLFFAGVALWFGATFMNDSNHVPAGDATITEGTYTSQIK